MMESSDSIYALQYCQIDQRYTTSTSSTPLSAIRLLSSTLYLMSFLLGIAPARWEARSTLGACAHCESVIWFLGAGRFNGPIVRPVLRGIFLDVTYIASDSEGDEESSATQIPSSATSSIHVTLVPVSDNSRNRGQVRESVISCSGTIRP